MVKKFRIWILVVLFIPLTATADSVTVETMQVSFKNNYKSSSFSGLVGYQNAAVLSFKVDGFVSLESLPKEGSTVTKDDVLVSLISDEVDARLQEAKSKVLLLENTLDRHQKLYDKKLLPRQQLDQIIADLQQAKSQFKVAQFNQHRSKIFAPYDGVVLKVFSEQGELVQPFQPIIKVASTSEPWMIRIDVTEQHASRISVMDPVLIYFDIWPDHPVMGHVNTISEPIDNDIGLFPVEIIFNDDTQTIRAGYSARVEIPRSAHVALIPIQSIVGMRGTDQADVFIYHPETSSFHRQTISIAYIDGNQIAVKSGLDEGQFVITKGASYLTDGRGMGDVIVVDRQDESG